MEINSSNITQKELQKEVKTEVADTKPETLTREGSDVYPDSGVMRAYANIQPKGKTVSRAEALDFIHSTGCKFEQRCEQFLDSMTEDDGFIKQDIFDWVKNCYTQTNNLFLTANIVNNSKDNGRINRKVLEILEPILPQIKSMGSYSGSMCGEIPKYFKDKNGKFNNDFLEIIKQTTSENPAMLLRRPDAFRHYYLTKENEFDTQAIRYATEKLKTEKPIKEIQTDIGYAKNDDGIFSEENLRVYNELKSEGLEQWQIRKAQQMMGNANDKESCLSLAKQMKYDREMTDIIDTINAIKSSENNKTDFDYNEQSVALIKELRKESYGYINAIPDILKTLNLPLSEYTPEKINTIKRIFYTTRSNEDIKALLDVATYKAGDKKGQFSFDNLNKYMDIYKDLMGDVKTMQQIAGNLSLETDDYVLDTIHKLFNLTWEKESYGGNIIEDKLDRHTILFILDLAVMGHEGVPKRKAHRPVYENLNKLMETSLPMSSKEAFENFMVIPEFDVIEKLEKVRLDEIGLKTGQYTHGKFCQASEDELYAFKDYMTEYFTQKDPKRVNINLNSNLKDVIEIREDHLNSTNIIMYDLVKRKPTTEVSEQEDIYHIKREQKNYENNLVTRQLFRKEKIKYATVERLVSQTTEKYDNNRNLVYSEEMEQSPVKGVFNVTRTYADGRVEELVKAEKLPNGNDLVKKNLTSFDGTKTEYYYEDDVNGNRIMDYKIISPTGEVKMNRSVTFEVVDENHFVSSRNDKKYDIKFNGNTLTVTNLSTKEKVDIDLENFTKSTQEKIIPLLKQIPGDELFLMKKLNLGGLSNDNSVDNAAYRPGSRKDKDDMGEILISDKYIDDGVVLHEWGHGKDHIEFKEIDEEINNDPVLREIYKKEKAAFRANFSDAQLSHIAYFGADSHYLGSDNAIQEGIAETNAILSVLPKNDVSSVRAHYWMQYFPNTIAYLSTLLH